MLLNLIKSSTLSRHVTPLLVRHMSTTTTRKTGTHYDTLGVTKTATSAEIKKAFYAKAKVHHPDVSSNGETSQTYLELQTAYEVLSDSLQKRDYDASLAPPIRQYQSTSRRMREDFYAYTGRDPRDVNTSTFYQNTQDGTYTTEDGEGYTFTMEFNYKTSAKQRRNLNQWIEDSFIGFNAKHNLKSDNNTKRKGKFINHSPAYSRVQQELARERRRAAQAEYNAQRRKRGAPARDKEWFFKHQRKTHTPSGPYVDPRTKEERKAEHDSYRKWRKMGGVRTTQQNPNYDPFSDYKQTFFKKTKTTGLNGQVTIMYDPRSADDVVKPKLKKSKKAAMKRKSTVR